MSLPCSGTETDSITAAKAWPNCEKKFNLFTQSTPIFCSDPTLPTTAEFRGILSKIDTPVDGATLANQLALLPMAFRTLPPRVLMDLLETFGQRLLQLQRLTLLILMSALLPESQLLQKLPHPRLAQMSPRLPTADLRIRS